MATAARDRLARTLRGDVQAAFSVTLTAAMGDLNLEVEGFGHVKFPVTPAKARKLLGLGRPARFGRGEETVTDADVRDTWEIPKHLIRAEWNDAAMKVILATVKEELGLPNAAALTADLHSLLVYEPDQFFLAHQDSEKVLPRSCPGTAATLVSATSPPTAPRGSARGSPARGARPATGRSNCPRAAAHAICARNSACSWKTRVSAPSSGRSPSRAGSTSTLGSTPPNSPSLTSPGGKAGPTRSC